MTQIKSNIPKLRFKEFSGKWEEIQFGDYCNKIQSGKSINSDIGVYNLYGSTGIIGKCEEYSNIGRYILAARVGANAGKLNLINDKFGVTDNTLILDINNNLNINFIYNLLIKFNLNKLVFGSGQPLITGGQLKKIKINLPQLPEQQKIASFLSLVDEKIENIKEKKKSLEEYKKGVMQKIFKQEIRFKDENGGDLGDWEEKKLGDVIIENKKTNRLSSEGKDNGKYVFFNNSTKASNKFINDFDFDGEMIIANTGGIAYFDYFNGKFGVMSDCYVFSTKYNVKFLYYFLKKNEIEINIKGFTGSGIKHLNKTYFKKLTILLPPLPEQQKIADFLSGVDEKIESVGGELERVEEFKKGLLQGMFV